MYLKFDPHIRYRPPLVLWCLANIFGGAVMRRGTIELHVRSVETHIVQSIQTRRRADRNGTRDRRASRSRDEVIRVGQEERLVCVAPRSRQ